MSNKLSSLRILFFFSKEKIRKYLFTFSRWPKRSIIQNSTMKLSFTYRYLPQERAQNTIIIYKSDPTVKLSLHTKKKPQIEPEV